MWNNIVVDICNEAILKAGMDTAIGDLTENSNLAELCNRLFDVTLRELYSEHPWAFRKVVIQADLLEGGNPHTYAYPDECLRVLGFYRDKSLTTKDGLARVTSNAIGESVIKSPYAPLFLDVIVSNTTNDKLQPWLRRCMVTLLAHKIAVAKGKDGKNLLEEYLAWIDRAQENNASEDCATFTADDRFIDCR